MSSPSREDQRRRADASGAAGPAVRSSADDAIAEKVLWDTLARKLHTSIGGVLIAAESALQGARTRPRAGRRRRTHHPTIGAPRITRFSPARAHSSLTRMKAAW